MTGFREPIQGNVPYYLGLQVKERIEKLKVDAVERLELIRKKHPEFDFTFKDHKGLSSVIRITCKKCGNSRELILSNITRDGFSDVCKVCPRNAKYDKMLTKTKDLIKKYPDWEICYHDRRFVKIKHKCGEIKTYQVDSIVYPNDLICLPCRRASGMYRGGY